jgi:hypothetical protein
MALANKIRYSIKVQSGIRTCLHVQSQSTGSPLKIISGKKIGDFVDTKSFDFFSGCTICFFYSEPLEYITTLFIR